MAKAKKTSKTKNKPHFKKPNFTLNNQQKLVFGSFLVILGFLLFTAFLSFIFTGKADQSALSEFTTRDVETQNWLSKVGAWLSDVFIQRGFGIASFIFSGLTFLSGVFVLMDLSKTKLRRHWFWGTLIIIWFSVLFGFFTSKNDILSGTIGFEVNTFFQDYIGKLGTVLLLIFAFITYLAVRFKFTPQRIASLFNKAKAEIKDDLKEDFTPVDNSHSEEAENIKSAFEVNKDVEPTITNHSTTETSTTFEVSTPKDEEEVEEPILKTSIKEENGEEDVKIEVETVKEEESETDNLANKLVEDFGQFDPTLELGKYQYPPLDLLKKYDNEGVTINQQELEENKNRIVETLNNYKIGIDSIKATIGPTVTLYEIVPEAGVRISKIKNLEDDIALSLAALGIRIIAPIPGKGTIGIEVPNKNSTIVSMRSVIASQKFQKSEMQLPIAIGKTISNETLVIDLAKMPHLLMAGATGQGKSVGLNAVLTSLLYKKHPAEVKFVLVDPKKVELTLFNKIERHYLAKLPDSEDAIITDNTKVINTLNS